MKRTLALAAFLLPALLFAQADSQAGPWQSFLANLSARNVGPTNMGGRCVDLAVYNKEPRIFYVATASGGLWKTENGGTTMNPVFDREGSVSLGAAAVSQRDPNLVWVGTGEYTSRNSVAWGDGVYKSTDGGKTWTHMGLAATMHISRIVIDPRNDDVVYVGALGRLWGPNPERGVYKTTDGGKNWSLIFKIDENTGVADLQMNPKNPNEMLCSMWPRRRWAWDFISMGPTGGLYKTTDAGKTWRHITKGIPTWHDLDKANEKDVRQTAEDLGIANADKAPIADLKTELQKHPYPIGHIGLDYYMKDPKIVIATIEYDSRGEKTIGQTVSMNVGATYISKDGGESWTKLNSANPRPFYFSRPRIDPNDDNRMYLCGVGLSVSDDGGKSFKTARASIHADNHQLWIDPNDSYHLLICNDGGLYQSHDKGVKWTHINNMPIGQFYAVAFDMRKPYWVYGGLQDNGSWGQPTQSSRGETGWFDVINLGGGDGFHVASDPEDWRWFYSESQGGAITRYDLKSGAGRGIRPRGRGIRFNWSTPFMISPWNSATLYLGANKLFKSVDRGTTWQEISDDLTTNNPKKENPHEDTGAETHCTIITISESPKKQGLLYVGTDDGLVWITQDDGRTWTNLTANIPDLPANTWCSRVLASKFEEGRVYATFDGHRSNDFKPYVYVSEDFGKTWTKLNAGLPDNDSVYVVCEGNKNPDLLFLGSEMSLRVSLDRGKTWSRFRSDGFPTVAIHDLVVHPREDDLVIATHGRSLWTLDIGGLEASTSENRGQDFFLAPPQNVYVFGLTRGAPWDGDQVWAARNTQPGTNIQYWLKADQKDDVKIVISTADGARSRTLTGSGKAGLNVVRWDGRLFGRSLEPGDYPITVAVGGKTYRTAVHVEPADQN